MLAADLPLLTAGRPAIRRRQTSLLPVVRTILASTPIRANGDVEWWRWPLVDALVLTCGELNG